MLEILLIRHGQTDWNKERRIMGRRPVPLNAKGRKQASAIAEALKALSIDAVYTSPLKRAVETSRFLARGRKLRLEIAEDLSEIDYGLWVGRTFEEVSGEPEFQTYHRTPKHAQAPKGEKMTAVHRRVIRFIEKLKKKHKKGGRIVLVSHADVIKAVLIHYLGLDLNELLRLRIDNASLSFLWFNGTRHRVMAVNCPPSPTHLFDHGDQIL